MDPLDRFRGSDRPRAAAPPRGDNPFAGQPQARDDSDDVDPFADDFDANPLTGPRRGAGTTGSGSVVIGAGMGRRGAGAGAAVSFDRPSTPGQRAAPVALEAVGQHVPAAGRATGPGRMSDSMDDHRPVAEILASVRRGAPGGGGGGGGSRIPKATSAVPRALPTGGATGFGSGGLGGGGWGGNPLVAPGGGGAGAPVVVTGEVVDAELDAIDIATRYAGRTAVGRVVSAKPTSEEGDPPHSKPPLHEGGGGMPTTTGVVVMGTIAADDPWSAPSCRTAIPIASNACVGPGLGWGATRASV